LTNFLQSNLLSPSSFPLFSKTPFSSLAQKIRKIKAQKSFCALKKFWVQGFALRVKGLRPLSKSDLHTQRTRAIQRTTFGVLSRAGFAQDHKVPRIRGMLKNHC